MTGHKHNRARRAETEPFAANGRSMEGGRKAHGRAETGNPALSEENKKPKEKPERMRGILKRD